MAYFGQRAREGHLRRPWRRFTHRIEWFGWHREHPWPSDRLHTDGTRRRLGDFEGAVLCSGGRSGALKAMTQSGEDLSPQPAPACSQFSLTLLLDTARRFSVGAHGTSDMTRGLFLDESARSEYTVCVDGCEAFMRCSVIRLHLTQIPSTGICHPVRSHQRSGWPSLTNCSPSRR